MQRLVPFDILNRGRARSLGVRTASRRLHRRAGVIRNAVQGQTSGSRWSRGEAGDALGLIHCVFTHVAIGRPFPAGDGNQAGRGDQERVSARKPGGVPPANRPDQRTQAGILAENIPLNRLPGQVAAGVPKQIFDLGDERAWFEGDFANRRVGRSDQRAVVPRNREKHPTVIGARNQEGAVSGQKRTVQNDVGSLAGSDDPGRVRIVHSAENIGENAGGIDDDTGADGQSLPALQVAHHGAADPAVGLQQRLDTQVIDGHATEVLQGVRQTDAQPRVVKLAVEIANAAPQTFRSQGGQMFQHLRARNRLRALPLEFPGQQIVQFQARSVVGPFPPGIVGDDEGDWANQVRRIFQEASAFAQRFTDQSEVPLPQITQAPVNELGAPARGGFGKIALLDQHGAITPGRSLHGRSQTARPPADHQHIPDGGRFADSFQRFIAIHALWSPQTAARARISVHPGNPYARLHKSTAPGQGPGLQDVVSRFYAGGDIIAIMCTVRSGTGREIGG